MRAWTLVLVAIGAMLMCDRSAMADDKLATVEGVVTYKGKPLPDGIVTFHLPDDQFVGAKFKDGKYRLDRVPAGTVRVTIASDKVRLPAKFAMPETTPLTVEVTPGKSTTDINLTD